MLNKWLDPDGYKLPRLAELGPRIGVEVSRLDALTLPQLATEIMIRVFKPEYIPGGSMIGLGAAVDCFLPEYGAPRAGDLTTQPEYALRDLVAEGMQVLEQARLVRPSFGYNGGVAEHGWVTTRLGRWALATGNVPASVERVAAG
jgi:hypothetical protein